MAGNDPNSQQGQDSSGSSKAPGQHTNFVHEQSMQTYSEDTASMTSYKFRTMEDYMRDLEAAAERRRVAMHDPDQQHQAKNGPAGRVQFQLPGAGRIRYIFSKIIYSCCNIYFIN